MLNWTYIIHDVNFLIHVSKKALREPKLSPNQRHPASDQHKTNLSGNGCTHQFKKKLDGVGPVDNRPSTD